MSAPTETGKPARTPDPTAQELHSFLIADWRSQPDCHVCRKGAAYYQCRICGKGVHLECRPSTFILRPTPTGKRCVQVAYISPSSVHISTPGVGMIQCHGHFSKYRRAVCPPTRPGLDIPDPPTYIGRESVAAAVGECYASIQEGWVGGDTLPEWQDLDTPKKAALIEFASAALLKDPGANLIDETHSWLMAVELI